MSKLIPIQNPFRANRPETCSAQGGVDSRNTGQLIDAGTLLDNPGTLAGMLLAAVVAAMLVVADQVINTWADGQLLVGWVALWVVTFALLSYLAPSMRQMSTAAAAIAQRWAVRRAAQRADDRLWSLALQDHRLMGELHAARMRDHGETD